MILSRIKPQRKWLE